MPKGSTAIYLRIASELRGKIERHEFPSGRLPTERDMAEAYGVNRLTLRNALRLLFAEGLIAKMGVHGTFVADAAPVLRKMSAQKVLALFASCDMDRPYVWPFLLDALQRELQANGVELEFQSVGSPSELEPLLKRNAVRRDFDGIIVSGFMNAELLAKLQDFKLPVVIIGSLRRQDPIEGQFDRVRVDTFNCVHEGVSALLGRGYSKVALVDGFISQWSLLAQNAWRSAYTDQGLAVPEQLLFNFEDDNISVGMKQSKMVMKARPDALFIQSECVARGMFDGLFRMGVKIPEDIPVVTLGHPGDSVSHLGFPKLEFQPEMMVSAAVKLLLRRVANPKAEPVLELLKANFLRRAAIPAKTPKL
jgi:DNA-binding LacI/PurR family transcriptional regulator